MRYDKQTQTLTIPQKHLEAWINNRENFGQFLMSLGLPKDEYKRAEKVLENFRVKIDADPAFAAQVEASAKAGEGYQLDVPGTPGFTITNEGILEALDAEQDA
jgi:hypothetical protein